MYDLENKIFRVNCSGCGISVVSQSCNTIYCPICKITARNESYRKSVIKNKKPYKKNRKGLETDIPKILELKRIGWNIDEICKECNIDKDKYWKIIKEAR